MEKGLAFIRDLMSQNRIDIMEVTAMTEEVRDWNKRLKRLANITELEKTYTALIRQNAVLEDSLIRLEDERIDTKSALEKASFRRPNLTRTKSSNDMKDVEDLKTSLAKAEQRVRDARKEIRKWYRETRKFATDYAPELFYHLTDLRSAGSILGDGGFAEKTKLPRRKIEEYENVRPLIAEDSNASKISFGRHLLLRALFDNEEVDLLCMKESKEKV